MGDKSLARTEFEGTEIELPKWEESVEMLKGDTHMDDGGEKRHNYEEALDFLRLPYQVLH